MTCIGPGLFRTVRSVTRRSQIALYAMFQVIHLFRHHTINVTSAMTLCNQDRQPMIHIGSKPTRIARPVIRLNLIARHVMLQVIQLSLHHTMSVTNVMTLCSQDRRPMTYIESKQAKTVRYVILPSLIVGNVIPEQLIRRFRLQITPVMIATQIFNLAQQRMMRIRLRQRLVIL